MHRRSLVLCLALAASSACTVGPRAESDASTGDSGSFDGSRGDASRPDGGPRPDAGPPVCGTAELAVGDSCDADSQCDDRCFCNGSEECRGGVCVRPAAPCVDDVPCSTLRCDETARRCVFEGDDTMCDDSNPCNGSETCGARGCRSGLPPDCSDRDPCTVDQCTPAAGCQSVLRDLDGDGYGDGACAGGDDCADLPPSGAGINPGVREVCTNGLDENCNGLVDFFDPQCTPTYDSCTSPERLPGPGTYSRASTGLTSNHTLSCGTAGRDDAVFTFVLSTASDVSVSLTGAGSGGALALRPAATCATATDLRCASTTGTQRVDLRALAAGEYAILVKTADDAAFELTLEVRPETPRAPGDLCNTNAPELVSGISTGMFASAEDDFRISCNAGTGSFRDVVRKLVLSDARNVRIAATSITSTGTRSTAYVSLVRDCMMLASPLACATGNPAVLDQRDLAAGTYYLLVEAGTTTAASWELDVSIADPNARNPGDYCPSPLDITDAMQSVDLATVMLDTGTGCGGSTPGFRDATFVFTLSEPRAVTLTTNGGGVHYTSVRTTCRDLASETACRAGTPQIVQSFRMLAAGTYFVTVSTNRTSGALTAIAETAPPTGGPPGDTCAEAVPISGGYSATQTLVGYADDVNVCTSTARIDAFYALSVPERKNVTIVATRTTGSDALHVSLRDGCTASTDVVCASGQPAVIDRILEAGNYTIVVESATGSVGPYSLRVFFADP